MLLLLGRPPELQQDRTVATLRTIFIGTAERHEIYFSCLLFIIFATKWKQRNTTDICLHQVQASILNNCNSYKYLTTEPGYISYAFYTAGINCRSNWIKRPAKMVGKRCLHLFWVKVSFSCPLGYIYRQDEKKETSLKSKRFSIYFYSKCSSIYITAGFDAC